MKINKEGYRIIAVSGLVCLVIWLFFYWMLMNRSSCTLIVAATIFLICFWMFIVAFFREPRRVRIHDADLVFSPCDGRVVVTEVVMEKEHLKQEMLQISIFMSVTNVHMNWVPVPGGLASEIFDRERAHDDRGAYGGRPSRFVPPDCRFGGTSHRLVYEGGQPRGAELGGRLH